MHANTSQALIPLHFGRVLMRDVLDNEGRGVGHFRDKDTCQKVSVVETIKLSVGRDFKPPRGTLLGRPELLTLPCTAWKWKWK